MLTLFNISKEELAVIQRDTNKEDLNHLINPKEQEKHKKLTYFIKEIKGSYRKGKKQANDALLVFPLLSAFYMVI